MTKKIKEKILDKKINLEFNGYSIIEVDALLEEVYKEIIELESKNEILSETIEKLKLEIQEKKMELSKNNFIAEMKGSHN
ncbi:MAG0865 family DivIVA-related protein [Mycoplasma sp. Mirounga ES2805-ORL]|uniref:MAG0865 family DivIVA-related protein n=1 Tax=Mycoplasma sp. Mirounga ES2805-ORL TaxID=754514 RepID=UPI00197B1F36|nr:DivIVA domain-containing protein [Mycoplasma sp. Mirounga ES2805-ORL]QSF13492.1 DivIVA domain-containing protein [Mycoplasma sp. Mirounga ES2805-ORL]